MNTRLQNVYRDTSNHMRYGAFTFGGAPTELLLDRLRSAPFDREWVVVA